MRRMGVFRGGLMRIEEMRCEIGEGAGGSFRMWVDQGEEDRYASMQPRGSWGMLVGSRASGSSAGTGGRRSVRWWWEVYP